MILNKSFLVLFLSIIFIYGSDLVCQNYCDRKYDHIWILGGTDTDTIENRYGGCEINFNSSPPSLLRHSKYFDQLLQITSMSSKQGDLCFYSNGCLVLNPLDLEMENGDSLNPGELYEEFCPDHGYIGFQNMFALPDEYHDSIYYLFHIDLIDNLDTNLASSLISENLYCTTIDMAGENGLGTVKSKNQVVLKDTTMLGGPMSAVRHANGMDWWIICPNSWTNSHNRILVDGDGPHFINRQYIGIVPDSKSVGGQGKFSPDGSKFAWYHPSNGLYLYDFDRQEGLLSNFVLIEIPAYNGVSGGLEFSPSGNFLFVNHDTSLYQVDLLSPDIQSSLTHIADYDGFVDVLPTPFFIMERTPDHRIIMSPLFGSQWLHVIQEPDKKGKACRFEQHTLKLPTVNNWTLPHFPNYRLGRLDDPLCDSVMVASPILAKTGYKKFMIRPNPASHQIVIYNLDPEIVNNLFIELTDLQGRMVLRETTLSMDVSDVPSGLYFIKIYADLILQQLEKVVVQH